MLFPLLARLLELLELLLQIRKLFSLGGEFGPCGP
jgi:hypothetical protein